MLRALNRPGRARTVVRGAGGRGAVQARAEERALGQDVAEGGGGRGGRAQERVGVGLSPGLRARGLSCHSPITLLIWSGACGVKRWVATR